MVGRRLVFSIALSSLFVFATGVPSAGAALFGAGGQNTNSAGQLISSYGVSCANWVVNHPQLDPNPGPCQDPETGVYSRGCLINSIYATTYNGATYELGWYKTYERPDDAILFAVRANALGTIYEETPICRINDDCTAYLSLNHVPGTYNYKGYANGIHVFDFTGMGISSCIARTGAERFCYGDRNEAAWEQLKYRPTDTSWAYWDQVTARSLVNPDPVYHFTGDSNLNKGLVN